MDDPIPFVVGLHSTLQLVTCHICNEPIPLEASKTDESGLAVHEQCYLLRLQLKDATDS
jgi:hypothetical protein